MESAYYGVLHGVQERHWWYVARRQLLGSVLSDLKASGLPAGKLYDLGCGVGANLPVLEQFGPTVGVDGSSEAVAFCHGRGYSNVRQADLNSLEGIEPGSGSVVVLADVIEHLDDEGPCLEAARRLLAPGGALVVTVPAFMWLWSPADDINHHRRRYTEAETRAVVEKHGFRVEHTTYFNSLLFGTVLAGRVAERLLKRGGDDGAHVPPSPVNAALRTIFAAEVPLIHRGVRFPFGVSILCVARKD